MRQSPAYAFVLNMWVMDRITERQIQSYVPKILSQEEADMIMATPKLDER